MFKLLANLFDSDVILGLVRFTVTSQQPRQWPAFAREFLLTNDYASLKVGDVLVHSVYTGRTVKL